MSALESEDSEKFRTEGGSSLPHVGSINSGSLSGAAAGSNPLGRSVFPRTTHRLLAGIQATASRTRSER